MSACTDRARSLPSLCRGEPQHVLPSRSTIGFAAAIELWTRQRPPLGRPGLVAGGSDPRRDAVRRLFRLSLTVPAGARENAASVSNLCQRALTTDLSQTYMGITRPIARNHGYANPQAKTECATKMRRRNCISCVHPTGDFSTISDQRRAGVRSIMAARYQTTCLRAPLRFLAGPAHDCFGSDAEDPRMSAARPLYPAQRPNAKASPNVCDGPIPEIASRRFAQKLADCP